MFRPAAMIRLSCVVLARDQRAVLRELGRLGLMQLTRSAAGPDTAPFPPRDHNKELALCDRLLARVAELRQSLEPPTIVEKATPREMALRTAEEKLHLISSEADLLLTRRLQLKQRLEESIATVDRVSCYEGMEIPLDQPDSYSFLHFVTGSLPTMKLATLQVEIGDNVALLPLPEHGDRQRLIALTTRGARMALDSALQRAGFQPEPLPAVEGATVDSYAKSKQLEQKQLKAELDDLDRDIESFAAKFAHSLGEIELLATMERQLLEAEQHFWCTEAAVQLIGWVPADKVNPLEKRLRELTGGSCAVQTATPSGDEGEEIPVLPRLPRWLCPFKPLVSAYGLPSYWEVEPTLFVALSYVLMFGMMFGDVGHGLVLAVVGFLVWRFARMEKVRKLGLLTLFAAFSSIAFGIFYGSCFGLESFKRYALWHDPLERDPIGLMSGAIGIGIVMISLGLILNIINRFRRGDVIGGWLDKFGVVGLLFYWGMLALITKYAAIESQGLARVAILVFLVIPLVGWSLKEPIEYFARRRRGQVAEPGSGLFSSITESLVGAFEAVLSYLANTISFVRLAAYAMSHAALLLAAFMMADAVRHVAVGGEVLSVLVILLGNVIAIILEGIIASVQALRLEYYEFFGKFFSGSGRPFSPFRLVGSGWGQQVALP